MMAPDEIRARVAEWLANHQGERNRQQYAADISATGWSIDYTRLGRYIRQELPVGKDVLGYVNRYAEARGLDPVDLAPREAPLSLDERAVLAAEAQVEATRAQTEVYRAMVEQFQRQADAAEARADLLERLVIGLLAPAARATADPQALRVLEEWGQAALASMLSPQPEGNPASGSGGR